jgi:hypothetical protein
MGMTTRIAFAVAHLLDLSRHCSAPFRHRCWRTVSFIADGDGDEKIRGPVVFWVGVRPDSLLGEDAFNSSTEVLDLLASFDIDDVKVEDHESVSKRTW